MNDTHTTTPVVIITFDLFSYRSTTVELEDFARRIREEPVATMVLDDGVHRVDVRVSYSASHRAPVNVLATVCAALRDTPLAEPEILRGTVVISRAHSTFDLTEDQLTEIEDEIRHIDQQLRTNAVQAKLAEIETIGDIERIFSEPAAAETIFRRREAATEDAF